MAEFNSSTNPVQPYTVRHVDGVMHLTLNKPEVQKLAETLRVQPPADLSNEA